MNLEPLNAYNLFLIGYRCTGKSSVGRQLSATLGRDFVDTDSAIVSKAGISIRKIVEECGWKYFRRWEHNALRQVCSAGRQVVATGGGIVLDAANVELMKESGKIIWLRAAPDTIKGRMVQDLASQGFRPALTAKNSISEVEETLAEREPFYRQAMDFAVDTDNVGLDVIVDIIIENLNRLNPD